MHSQRQEALFVLYQLLLKKPLKLKETLNDYFLSDRFLPVLQYIEENQLSLSELIDDYLNNWSFNRLGYLEQAILLLSCGEAIVLDTPKQVIINEAIEFAKKFGDQDDSYKLINATLDKVLNI